MAAFPRDLAKVVSSRWHNMVAGAYEAPPCPPINLLIQMLEFCYLAASSPEEARYPKFNVVAVSADKISRYEKTANVFRFKNKRDLNLSEIRRLAPAVDIKKSAILTVWGTDGWIVYGLVDLGTTWHRARSGLGYRYREADALLVQVDRPGRISVHQGQFHVATLSDGALEGAEGIPFNLFLHSTANNGLASMEDEIDRPDYENPKDFLEFEFIALWNTYAAIANIISEDGHGGMLIISPHGAEVSSEKVKVKYEMESDILRISFIKFINARHIQGDCETIFEDGHNFPEEKRREAYAEVEEAYNSLVEATRFVAALAGCDGSILISDGLRVIGFGGEIKTSLRDGVKVCELEDEMSKKFTECNVEQFGMRHRSAVKLASQGSDIVAITISQDGPISGIWSEGERVWVKKNVKLRNLNMPWA